MIDLDKPYEPRPDYTPCNYVWEDGWGKHRCGKNVKDINELTNQPHGRTHRCSCDIETSVQLAPVIQPSK